jgi:hypothetical protein
VIIGSILDWLRCSLAICDLLAHPHSSIPQVQIGFMIVLYRSTLLSSDVGDFLPTIRYKSFTFRSICFLFRYSHSAVHVTRSPHSGASSKGYPRYNRCLYLSDEHRCLQAKCSLQSAQQLLSEYCPLSYDISPQGVTRWSVKRAVVLPECCAHCHLPIRATHPAHLTLDSLNPKFYEAPGSEYFCVVARHCVPCDAYQQLSNCTASVVTAVTASDPVRCSMTAGKPRQRSQKRGPSQATNCLRRCLLWGPP